MVSLSASSTRPAPRPQDPRPKPSPIVPLFPKPPPSLERGYPDRCQRRDPRAPGPSSDTMIAICSTCAPERNRVSVRSSRDDLVKKICPILFGGFDGEVLVTLFDMRYFCAHVVSSTGLADDPGPGSGAWIRSALLGREAGPPRRPPEAASRTGGRCSSASGGGRRNCAAARSAGAPRRGPGSGSSRSVGTSWRGRGPR